MAEISGTVCLVQCLPARSWPLPAQERRAGIHCLRMCLISWENRELPCHIHTTVTSNC